MHLPRQRWLQWYCSWQSWRWLLYGSAASKHDVCEMRMIVNLRSWTLKSRRRAEPTIHGDMQPHEHEHRPCFNVRVIPSKRCNAHYKFFGLLPQNFEICLLCTQGVLNPATLELKISSTYEPGIWFPKHEWNTEYFLGVHYPPLAGCC